MMDAPALTFDEPSHVYRWGELVVPSVTQVISDTLGDPFAQVPRGILEAAQQRGRAVHFACALHDQNRLHEYDIPADTMAYVEQWVKFRREWEYGKLPFGIIEEPKYHELLGFAGTPDRASDFVSWHLVLDIKTGYHTPHVGIQTAGYATLLGWRGHHTRRFSVYLEPTRYVLTECSDHRDFNNWLACLTVYQLRHRKPH